MIDFQNKDSEFNFFGMGVKKFYLCFKEYGT